MHDVYAAVCKDGKGLSKLIADRIAAWSDRRFFNVDGILYTQASFVCFRDYQHLIDEGHSFAIQIRSYCVLKNTIIKYDPKISVLSYHLENTTSYF